MHEEKLAKMRRARVFHHLALTTLVVTLVMHIFEVDLGLPRLKVWGLGLGVSAFFGLAFIASAPISTEAKLRFWTVFGRTHLSDFIEMSALRSSLIGSFRMVAWFFTVGGILTMFTPKYLQGLDHLDGILAKRFTPIQTRQNVARLETARAQFEQDPGSIEACRELAYLLLATRRPEDAMAVLDRGLEANPASFGEEPRSPSRLDLLTLKAVACRPLGHDQQEVELWREILADRDEDVEARHNLGIALLRMGNVADAEVELERAVNLAVDDLKRYKRTFRITARSVKTLAENLKAQLEGLKYRAGAAAYQLAVVAKLREKDRDAPRHLKLAHQLGFEISNFEQDVQRYLPQATPAPRRR